MWKLREARKGTIPMGPNSRRKMCDPDVEMKVLPVRMAEPDVNVIDAAWKRHGFKSRMAFLREAMGALLEAKGETTAAEVARAS